MWPVGDDCGMVVGIEVLVRLKWYFFLYPHDESSSVRGSSSLRLVLFANGEVAAHQRRPNYPRKKSSGPMI